MVNKILTHSKYGAVKVDHRFVFGTGRTNNIDFLNKSEFNLLKRINVAIASNLIAGYGDEYEDKNEYLLYSDLFRIKGSNSPHRYSLPIFYRFHKVILDIIRGNARPRYRGKSKVEKREAGYCTLENATTFNIYRKYI